MTAQVYDGTEHVVTGYEVTGISNVLYTKEQLQLQRKCRSKAYSCRKDRYGPDGSKLQKRKCELQQCDL